MSVPVLVLQLALAVLAEDASPGVVLLAMCSTIIVQRSASVCNFVKISKALRISCSALQIHPLYFICTAISPVLQFTDFA